MARQLLVERLIDCGRSRIDLVARQPARIALGHAQHGIIELVGALEPGAGVLFLAGEFEDHAGVQILEQRIPFRAGQLVDIGDRRLGVAGAVAGPTRQQRRHQVGDRPADRLVDVELRGGIFLQLDVLDADHKARHAIGLVDRENPVGELDRLVDIAFGDRGDEGAIQKLVVLRIGAQRRTVKGRRRGCVALHAGMAGGEIAARRGQRFQIPVAWKLRRIVGGVVGGLGQDRARHCQHREGEGGNGPAIATNGKHHGSLLLLGMTGVVSNANPTGGIKAGDNAAFGVQPQGFGANRMEQTPACQLLAITPSAELKSVKRTRQLRSIKHQIEKPH